MNNNLEKARFVSDILHKVFEDYTNQVSICFNSKIDSYYILLHSSEQLPRDFPKELYGVKIVTEQLNEAISY